MADHSSTSDCDISSESSPSGSLCRGEGSQERQYTITPYMFEPEVSDDDLHSTSDGGDDADWRLDTSRKDEWCCCKHCQVMTLPRECLCCQEIPEVRGKLEEAEALTDTLPECILDHPGLNAICFNPWALQCAWARYKQLYGGKAFEGPTDAKFRHVAYRQFVTWCWEYLGKDIRVVLPSCFVSSIRAHFPPPGLEEDFVFAGHKLPTLKK
ncbi:uncharacterized protein LOC130914682 [Corythoichthys intestinalis]|uniref:uncharacterized protein LOC130913532 n=1 Tax=Corythoichthys intestinalis TaxID=161448 RepID=UPI0025A66224|nr:uncharacterized protein LOC130913532 [Corythoichthys intestinalis]XP_057690089.1 uncharacterized protein LOC130914682 [Corythoichthys intestinalis]